MNPLIVIPSYWTKSEQDVRLSQRGTYDYTTPLDKPLPELERCLSALDQVRGVLRVAVLLVADENCAEAARARVSSICRAHTQLNPLVIGQREAEYIERAVRRVMPHMVGETVSLRGYGAIKNLGLAVACILGHDAVVFLDDDQEPQDPEFLIKACYGLGSRTRQDLPIFAKSGYFIDDTGSPYAKSNHAWSEEFWSKARDFNRVMQRMLEGPTRICRSNHMCGGCCALHASAFTEVPFDPYITRGEDLDYVLNLRSRGMDVWFDSQWSSSMTPPEDSAPETSRFMQDVYRWLYEYRKLEFINSRRDFRTITSQSLMPYPAPWLSAEVRKRIWLTALRRMITGPHRLAYLRILTKGRYDADQFAQSAATRYLSFAMVWPSICASLWKHEQLRGALEKMGSEEVLFPLMMPNMIDRERKSGLLDGLHITAEEAIGIETTADLGEVAAALNECELSDADDFSPQEQKALQRDGCTDPHLDTLANMAADSRAAMSTAAAQAGTRLGSPIDEELPHV